MTSKPSAAEAIFPHLNRQGEVHPTWSVRPRERNALAESMWPSLVPQPQPEPPAPTSRLTREQAWDWSNVDPAWAAMVGLKAVK